MIKNIKLRAGNCKFKALHLKNPFELMLGLMFRKRGNALIEFPWEGKPGIWMLFMRYSLNLVFLDKNLRVIDILKNIPPLFFSPKTWKTYYPKNKYKYVLELDVREKIEIKQNSRLEFI
ncbi:MAG: DUF192 domain-containing protein [Candidatus Aenigmarchaeota archaeon]|nr:DUF192 domain-containing protein [Candidatus Aenigmarchaeota archaeon]